MAYCIYATDALEEEAFDHWPWSETYWNPNPNDRIHNLVRAGALIAAEIDRLEG